MIPLDKNLQEEKASLTEFGELTERVLQYIPNVLSSFHEKNNYIIYSSEIAGTTKYIRPINKNLFINNFRDFNTHFQMLQGIFLKLKNKVTINNSEMEIIDKTVYTIQQSIGVGLDLLVNPNSARKHVGNRFEELIRTIFSEIGISNKKIVLQIPYNTEDGTKTYKCENDLILSPYDDIKSSSTSLDVNEVVVSVKTSSKDRMGKIFIDKILLERFIEHPQKVIGIFFNDVQRKEADNISYTLVSGLFMVYSQFLTQLDGIYYIDPPPNVNKKPYANHMKKFSYLLAVDIRKLLAP